MLDGHVVGLETAVSICLDKLVKPGIIDLPRLVTLLTTGPAEIRRLAKGTLREGADADVTVHRGGQLRVVGVEVQNFCAVEDAQLSFTDSGALLIEGPMGSGKTSLCDAITWGLFGVTTPRKPGASTASLRGDEMIRDGASACRVAVRVEMAGHPLTILRSKRRKKGAVVEIHGVAEEDMAGISDAQEQIHKAIGLDYALWRSCVYLGQGAVARKASHSRLRMSPASMRQCRNSA